VLIAERDFIESYLIPSEDGASKDAPIFLNERSKKLWKN
jgi:hypothetical protein